MQFDVADIFVIYINVLSVPKILVQNLYIWTYLSICVDIFWHFENNNNMVEFGLQATPSILYVGFVFYFQIYNYNLI